MIDTWQDGPLGTIVAFAGGLVVIGLLEAIERFVAPPEARDPRLGLLGFWLSVLIAAAGLCVLWPLIKAPTSWIGEAARLLGVVPWIARKLGVMARVDKSQREREQLWAMTVGAAIAVAIREFLIPAST